MYDPWNYLTTICVFSSSIFRMTGYATISLHFSMREMNILIFQIKQEQFKMRCVKQVNMIMKVNRDNDKRHEEK